MKEEVRRLARREIKALTSRTARAVAQYRREIARLKRNLREQERKLSAFAKHVQRAVAVPSPADELKGKLRFSARSARSQRRRTGLSAADYARLVGVTPLTIYSWESGKSRPRQAQFETLVSLRGLGKREARAKLDQLTAPGTRKKARQRKR